MAKKKRNAPFHKEGRGEYGSREEAEKYGASFEARDDDSGKRADSASSLKDLLNPDVLAKLKSQAAEMKVEEEQRREEERKKAAEARKAEQERQDNDFAHLLEKSDSNWRNYK
ncbi:YqkE family protein [Gorillibacterium massiliense]|uniref:YqkE family protein n=1 Tax=Gorillibacterium massiliense TaxID=1280390 RepID=UPI0004BAE5A9